MKKIFLALLFLFALANTMFSQTKVSGVVLDKKNQTIPFASVVFKNSTEGIVANEDGKFYLESSKDYTIIVVSSEGYSEREVTLTKSVNYDFKIVLNERESLKEVVVYSGKTSKKKQPSHRYS